MCVYVKGLFVEDAFSRLVSRCQAEMKKRRGGVVCLLLGGRHNLHKAWSLFLALHIPHIFMTAFLANVFLSF